VLLEDFLAKQADERRRGHYELALKKSPRSCHGYQTIQLGMTMESAKALECTN